MSAKLLSMPASIAPPASFYQSDDSVFIAVDDPASPLRGFSVRSLILEFLPLQVTTQEFEQKSSSGEIQSGVM